MNDEIELLKKMISIPSQIGIENEEEISDYMAKVLQKKEFKVEIFEFKKGRKNIIATYKFKENGPKILFNGHMDTMPAQNGEKISIWKTDPFIPTIIDGKLYGRGACDMKGGIAGALSAIFDIIDNDLGKGEIIVNLVCDEENTSLYGTIPICERKLLNADVAIVMEPTENKVCKKQLGNMFFESHILGDGGHTGLPEGKINPYEIADSYLTELKKWVVTKRVNINASQPFINVGRYEGGTSSGTIPTECTLYWGTRVMPKDNFCDYEQEIKELTNKFNSTLDPRCRVETNLFESGGIDSFFCESDLLDKILEESHESESIFCASSDAGFLWNMSNINVCVYGPGSLKQAHLPNEYIEVQQLQEYKKNIYNFLKNL